jgi:hypothetical protein
VVGLREGRRLGKLRAGHDIDRAVAAALAKHPDARNLAQMAVNGLPVDVILRASHAELLIWKAVSDDITHRRNSQT